MSYRVRYIDGPVRKHEDGSLEAGILAVFTTRIKGRIAQAVIPLPKWWWEQHQVECRAVAKKMARDVFEGMRAENAVAEPEDTP